MVGWRSGGASISSGPTASSQLFTRHFGSRGPENRTGWSPEEPDTSVMGSSYSPSMYSQPTGTTLISGSQQSSPMLGRRVRGVFMDGPVFASKYQPSGLKNPKYNITQAETLRPPKENGTENGSRRSSLSIQEIAPLIVMNGHSKAPKKRKAPLPPSKVPPPPPLPEPRPDYDDPPESILSTSSNGSLRKKVSINDYPDYYERPDYERDFNMFKSELQKSAEERSKKGHIEPPSREKAPVEASLNEALKHDIIKAAEERSNRPFIEPTFHKSNELGQIMNSVETRAPHPTLPEDLQNEMKRVWAERFDRRKSGSLRMKSNKRDNRVLYTAFPATSLASAVKKDETKEWVPEQDLVDDVLDGPVIIKSHTSRNELPTFFPMFIDPNSDMDSVRPGSSHKKSSSSRLSTSSKTGSKQGSRKGKKIKNSIKNAWGSLRRSIGKNNKVKDIMNDPTWEIYHAENFDPPPKGPINIHHIESKPAYAYNPSKGQLMLIPNFDRVIVTNDGRHIREDTLTNVATTPEPPQQPPSFSTNGMTPREIEVEKERREQMRAEIQFQIVRRQTSKEPETKNDDNYSSLDRLIQRRDNVQRTNPIYDSDDDFYPSESSDSPVERPRKRNSKLEDSGYGSNSTPPMLSPTYPVNGLPTVIPIAPNFAMYPGMPVAPNMVPYMMPQWGIPQQPQQPPTPAWVASMTSSNASIPVPPTVPPPPPINDRNSTISSSNKSTLINISYDPPPLTVNTSLSTPTTPQTSPPIFKPVKFLPNSNPTPYQPPSRAASPPPFVPPPPVEPTRPMTPPPIVVDPPKPEPKIPVSPPGGPKPFSYAPIKPVSLSRQNSVERYKHYGSTTSLHTKKEIVNKKGQVVADKEMPNTYRTDFYRKLLQGPVGWKSVEFNPDFNGAKERYLIQDSDSETEAKKKEREEAANAKDEATSHYSTGTGARLAADLDAIVNDEEEKDKAAASQTDLNNNNEEPQSNNNSEETSST